MRGLVVVAIVVVACGRIGFDPRTSPTESGDGAQAIDAVVVTGDGSVAGCGYVQCATNDVACCVSSRTACVPSASCGGIMYLCSPADAAGCSKTEQCCVDVLGNTSCAPNNSTCPGQ